MSVSETEKKVGASKTIKKVIDCLYFPVAVLYLELVTAGYTVGLPKEWSVLYIALFSFSFGFLLYGICALFGRKARYIVSIVLLALVTLIFGVQAVYYTIFKTFTVVSSVLRAGDVMGDFGEQALGGIAKSWAAILLLLLPLLLYIIFARRFLPKKPSRLETSFIGFGLFIVMYIAAFWGVYLNTSGIMSDRYVYLDTFSTELSVPRFGIVTTMRLDIENMLLPDRYSQSTKTPAPEETPEETPEPEPEETPEVTEPEPIVEEEPEPEPVVYEPRVLEIDFDSLIANESNSVVRDMHEYFSSVEPTYTNEYTGMFEGKNLIWIVAEGFSKFALSEEYTPTLTKMSQEGFVFNNFYNPVWGVSTSDGEYTTLQSLIPKSGVWSMSRSSKNYLPFAFGNLLKNEGYVTKAYHDHTYTYYDRDSSHPNMGYDYKAVGNGLDIKVTWPESDLEMMEKTVDEYVSVEPFHVYYMTVSGHMNYNFYGNTMCAKHKSEVQPMLDAGYSEAAAAYIACQIELDNAVEYLISALSDAGVLDDTVIVISGDHYPYGLEISEIEELYGGTIDQEFELYHTTLIIWNSEMEEPVTVDKYCQSLDIMPTLANLFDLPVDSRLVMGRDILSDSSPLVIFNDRSFITELGRYNSKTDTFTPNEGVEVPEGYAAGILQEVNDKFTYSARILENDYYAKVFPDGVE